MSENPTRRYVEHALADNGVIELRHQDGQRWTSGLFDNADDLLVAARSRHRVGNLFISLNRPSPRIADNRMGSDPLGNADMQWITRLFFDFDPIRPKDTASTEDELSFARRAAEEVQKIFKVMAWPDPLMAISGNGAHLLYRTHQPNTAEIRDMLGVIYAGLRQDFSTDQIDFDRAVKNPGRIGPLYGSIKRKGPNTPDRPHRQSRIVTWPREWTQVSRRSLDGVANFYAQRQPVKTTVTPPVACGARFSGSGDYASLDVVAWFTAHGLYRRSLGSYGDSQRHAVRCPWEGEHSTASNELDTSTVVFEAGSGWPGFHCSHSHCEGRTLREVLQVLGDADVFCSRQWGERHV